MDYHWEKIFWCALEAQVGDRGFSVVTLLHTRLLLLQTLRARMSFNHRHG